MKRIDIKKIDTGAMVEGISSQVFLKYLPLVLMFVFFSMIYISARFDCESAKSKSLKLAQQLEITRADVQRERSLYMSATCESSMQNMIDSLNLGLKIQERPPFKLSLP